MEKRIFSSRKSRPGWQTVRKQGSPSKIDFKRRKSPFDKTDVCFPFFRIFVHSSNEISSIIAIWFAIGPVPWNRNRPKNVEKWKKKTFSLSKWSLVNLIERFRKFSTKNSHRLKHQKSFFSMKTFLVWNSEKKPWKNKLNFGTPENCSAVRIDEKISSTVERIADE